MNVHPLWHLGIGLASHHPSTKEQKRERKGMQLCNEMNQVRSFFPGESRKFFSPPVKHCCALLSNRQGGGKRGREEGWLLVLVRVSVARSGVGARGEWVEEEEERNLSLIGPTVVKLPPKSAAHVPTYKEICNRKLMLNFSPFIYCTVSTCTVRYMYSKYSFCIIN